MFRRALLSLTFLAALGAAGFVIPAERADAQRVYFGPAPRATYWGTPYRAYYPGAYAPRYYRYGRWDPYWGGSRYTPYYYRGPRVVRRGIGIYF